MQIHTLVLVAAVVAVIAIGCFKLGAEFCPPNVTVERDGTKATIGPRLARDAGAEQ